LVLAKQGKLNQGVRLILTCIEVNGMIDKKSKFISDQLVQSGSLMNSIISFQYSEMLFKEMAEMATQDR
jgi:hypothetical protein